MALARYFAKDLLAISQVLRKNSRDEFERILNSHVIEIAFDNSVSEGEALISVDLAISLISRLCPKIRITDITNENSSIVTRLAEKAKQINSNIEIVTKDPTASLIIGSTTLEERSFTIYIGSDTWISKLSLNRPVRSSNSKLPFAAGVAVCLGVSNMFRFVFKDLLKNFSMDSEFDLSLLTLSGDCEDQKVELSNLDINEVLLVGIGAIGNGFIWAMSQISGVKGILTLIDPQNIELSNLQRYCLTIEEHINIKKVRIIEKFVNNYIHIDPFEGEWADYLTYTQNWKNKMICVAVDSVKDRIAIQSSLPKYLLNGYTENNLAGISRHFEFNKKACLTCGLVPEQKTKSYSEEVAENLRIPQFERLIRDYLHLNKSIDNQLLELIASANSIDLAEIIQYEGASMRDFYSRAVCGGHLQYLNSSNETIELEAPLSFQSTLAGILLASELILYKAGVRNVEFYNQTHVYPLYPISNHNPYNHTLEKCKTGRCICNDKIFNSYYSTKWS